VAVREETMSAGAGVVQGEPGRSPGDSYIDQMIAGRDGLENCARCGGTHALLYWKRFTRPAPSDHGQYRAWATCPSTGEPILFEIQVVRDVSPDPGVNATAPDAG
jgi:hypothetical protein